MHKERKGRFIDRAWVAVIALLLLAGVVRLACFPKEINEYENRYAQQAPAWSLDAYLDDSYQEGLESALADQVPLAQQMKRAYNVAAAGLHKPFWLAALRRNPGRYVRFQSLYSFCDGGEPYIVYLPDQLYLQAPVLKARAAALNRLMAGNPGPQYYACFIETDTDINFASGAKVGCSDYLLSRLELPAGQTCCFEVHDFADFSRHFYRTDHHWSQAGSYLCYEQVAAMLGVEPLVPQGELTLAADFSGSQTSVTLGSDRLLPERVSLYQFDFPPFTVRINGAEAEDYGWQSRFCAGAELPKAVSYGLLYGGDHGLVELITDNVGADKAGAGNLLMLGESFDNALVKLLASSFEHTYAVDLRNYEAQLGEKFSFTDFVSEHDIDRVLFIGSSGYFTNDELMPEN